MNFQAKSKTLKRGLASFHNYGTDRGWIYFAIKNRDPERLQDSFVIPTQNQNSWAWFIYRVVVPERR